MLFVVVWVMLDVWLLVVGVYLVVFGCRLGCLLIVDLNVVVQLVVCFVGWFSCGFGSCLLVYLVLVVDLFACGCMICCGGVCCGWLLVVRFLAVGLWGLLI